MLAVRESRRLIPGEGPTGAVLPRGGGAPPPALWGGCDAPVLPPPPLLPPGPAVPVLVPRGGSEVMRGSRHWASSIALHKGHTHHGQGKEGRGRKREERGVGQVAGTRCKKVCEEIMPCGSGRSSSGGSQGLNV